MTRLELMDAALEDLDRIVTHLREHESTHSHSRAMEILVAIDVLRSNPHIGRRVGDERRELVIGRDSKGYLALYRHASDIDTVFVLAIRAQREAGYTHV